MAKLLCENIDYRLMSKYNVIISKTSNGKMDYLQIMSEDGFCTNIVLISEKITITDHREGVSET